MALTACAQSSEPLLDVDRTSDAGGPSPADMGVLSDAGVRPDATTLSRACRPTPSRSVRLQNEPIDLGDANLVRLPGTAPVTAAAYWPGASRTGDATFVGRPCGPDQPTTCTPSLVLIQGGIASAHRDPVAGAAEPLLWPNADGSMLVTNETQRWFIDDGRVQARFARNTTELRQVPFGGTLVSSELGPDAVWGHQQLGGAIIPANETIRSHAAFGDYLYVISSSNDAPVARVRAASRTRWNDDQVIIEGARIDPLRSLFGWDRRTGANTPGLAWYCVQRTSGVELVAILGHLVHDRFRSPAPVCDDHVLIATGGTSLFLAAANAQQTDLYRVEPDRSEPTYVATLPFFVTDLRPQPPRNAYVFEGASRVFAYHRTSAVLYSIDTNGEVTRILDDPILDLSLSSAHGGFVAHSPIFATEETVVVFDEVGASAPVVLTLAGITAGARIAADGTLWLRLDGPGDGNRHRLVAIRGGEVRQTYEGVTARFGLPNWTRWGQGILTVLSSLNEGDALYHLRGADRTRLVPGSSLRRLPPLSSEVAWVEYIHANGTKTIARWDGERLTSVFEGMDWAYSVTDVFGETWFVLEYEGDRRRLIRIRGAETTELVVDVPGVELVEGTAQNTGVWAYFRPPTRDHPVGCICRLDPEAPECVEPPDRLREVSLFGASGPRGPVGWGTDANGDTYVWRTNLDWLDTR